MRVASRSAVSRVAQSESVATSGSVPARVWYAAAARNRKGPAKRSFRGVCPRVFCPRVFLTVSHRPYHKGLTLLTPKMSRKRSFFLLRRTPRQDASFPSTAGSRFSKLEMVYECRF